MTFQAAYRRACENLGIPLYDEITKVDANTKKLVLSGNCRERFHRKCSSRDIQALCISLQEYPWLVELDLQYMNIGDSGAILLAEFLESPVSCLEGINLASNNIEAEGAKALCHALSGQHRLLSLILRHNPLGQAGGLAIGEMLGKNRSLVGLDTSYTKLGHRALQYMFIQAEHHPTLTAWQCDDPLIHGIDELKSVIHRLSFLLMSNQVLEELQLGQWGLETEHLRTIFPSLSHNHTLHTLSLRGNQITDDGACILAEVLKMRPQFEYLDLSFNRIQNEGAEMLANGLMDHPSLRTLYLSVNRIDSLGLSALSVAIGTMSQLEHLSLWGNYFDRASCEAFYQIREKLASLIEVDFLLYLSDGVPAVCKVNPATHGGEG